MTMIERVARAICIAVSEQTDARCTCEPGTCIARWTRPVASAAIEAMREPTDAMVRAGAVVVGGELGAAEAWAAMIRLALAEP